MEITQEHLDQLESGYIQLQKQRDQARQQLEQLNTQVARQEGAILFLREMLQREGGSEQQIRAEEKRERKRAKRLAQNGAEPKAEEAKSPAG